MNCVHPRKDLFEMMNVFRDRFHNGFIADIGFCGMFSRVDFDQLKALRANIEAVFISIQADVFEWYRLKTLASFPK